MSTPVDIDVSRPMTASRDALWDVLDDLSRLADWLAFAGSVPERSSDRAAPGVTYTVKPHRFFEPTTHWRITEVEPQRRQLHTSEMPMFAGVTSEITLEGGADGGVRARVQWRGEPSKLSSRVMRGMFEKQIRTNWERSLERLDEVAGGGA